MSAPVLPPSPTARADVLSVLSFWRQAGPARWFAKDPEFDRRFRERFLGLHESAVRGVLRHWQASAEGALALVLLLDQFPRNAFRGTPRMYATDAASREVAAAAIAAGHDGAPEPEMALFLYLPFGHSEAISDQERAVALCQWLGEPHLARAEHHRGIIRRFGRFPHRNAILGRAATPPERDYLAHGGFAG